MRIGVAWLMCSSLWIAPAARAELLPGVSRAIPQSTSASRDAPVIELAYGPRAQITLGGELGIYRRGDLRLSAYLLWGLENGTSQVPFPTELYRVLLGATVSRALRLHRGVLELSAGVGYARAGALSGYQLPDPVPGDGIPFGGGGLFLVPEVAWRGPVGPIEVTVRAAGRLHAPALLLVAGQRGLADVVGDTIGDGLIQEPALDVSVRWPLTPRWQPLLALHGGLLLPLDESARVGSFTRLWLGVTRSRALGQLTPFVSGDAGNGLGMLINRHELRVSAGLRYAPF